MQRIAKVRKVLLTICFFRLLFWWDNMFAGETVSQFLAPQVQNQGIVQAGNSRPTDSLAKLNKHSEEPSSLQGDGSFLMELLPHSAAAFPGSRKILILQASIKSPIGREPYHIP